VADLSKGGGTTAVGKFGGRRAPDRSQQTRNTKAEAISKPVSKKKGGTSAKLPKHGNQPANWTGMEILDIERFGNEKKQEKMRGQSLEIK